MSNRAILISVFLTIISLAVGYYLNLYASRKNNRQFLETLREELDIIDDHYERVLTQNEGNLDEVTRKYLEARRQYMRDKLNSVEKVYGK